VNQSSGAVSSTGLTTNDYFNHRGELIEDSEPGGLVMKYQFDGAGRQIESYTTDGAGGTSWSAASSVSSDNVLEQTDTTYDSDGNVILTAQRERDHNDTAAGALGNVTTSPEARIYYTASYFDAVNRIVDSVNVGDDGGSTYTRPGTAPSSSATVLVTGYSYGSAGWLQGTTDPRGIVTEDSYSNLGELTQEVQDYTGGSITATTNKTTDYTYDGRLETVTYPDSYTVTYNYGTGIDNTISRLTSISDTTGTLEAYVYLGLDTVVQRTRPQINEEMTLISQTSSTGDGGDQYTGLDWDELPEVLRSGIVAIVRVACVTPRP
jgi:YD repeat-containing protein